MYSIILSLAPTISTYLLIFAVFTPGTQAQTQVLDTSFPILIEENTKTYSSFGYTVSLAKGTREIPNQPTGWVFIGAPKSNVSREIRYGGASGDDDKEAGVLWRCSLGHTNNKDGCKIMNIDPSPNSSDKKRSKYGSPVNESHSSAFIGGTLEIKNGHLVTCGFGWKRGGNKCYNGLCYWFKSNVNVQGRSKFDREDVTNLVNRSSYDHRLMPFFQSGNIKDQPDQTFLYYNGPGNLTSGREWLTGQAGISVNLFNGKDQSTSNLLIGAPGVRESSGSVVLYTNSNRPRKEMERLNRNDPTFSEFVVLNRGEIPMARDNGLVKYHWNEYFGYSVSSGRYFRKEKVLYVAGSPRAYRRGAVTIFDEPPYNKGINETYKRQIKEIQEIVVPSKREKNSFGSYFGSVIYTVDLDGNELDELVVGAPMYSFMGQNTEAGDHGCVFIYNKDKNGSDKMVLGQVLVGSKTSKARFGSAISSIVFNFINKPRQVYLVIGAPFEETKDIGEDSTGAIYLYKSLLNGSLESEYSQRIVASQFGYPIKAFGTSISNAEDIDDNQTPDLAIGAFESSHAIILRTRPQIDIHSTLKFQEGRTGAVEIKRGSTQFSFESCFTIDEILGSVQNPTEIWVKLSFADNRIKFNDSKSGKSGNMEISLKSGNELIYKKSQVDTHSHETCEPFQILAVNQQYGLGYGKLPNSTNQDDFPITFFQEVWFNGTKNQNQTTSKLGVSGGKNSYDFSAFYPKLPSAQHVKTEVEIPISLSECSGRVCKPDIEMEWTFFYPNDINKGDEGEDVKPNYTLSEHLLGQTRKEIVMQLSISNRNETTLLKSVVIEWNLKNVRERSGGHLKNKCALQSTTLKTQYLCPFLQYIRKDRNATLIQIYLEMDEIFVNSMQKLEFVVNAQLNFNDSDHIESISSSGGLTLGVPKTMALISGSKNSKEILRAAQIYNVTDSLSKTLYAPFQQRFMIEVQGASVSEILAEFKIPVVPNNMGDHSPYFIVAFPYTSTPYNGTFANIECVDAPFSRSPFRLVRIGSSAMEHKRKRRQVYKENQTVASPNVKGLEDGTTERASKIAQDTGPPTFHKAPSLNYSEEYLKFDCNSSETGCIEVTCTIFNVRAKRHFHVVFDIYPVKDEIDKLLKESGKNSLFFESTGIVAIFPREKGTTTSGGDIMHYSDTHLAQTVLTQIVPGQVQLWIYVAAGCGGLLFLALITVGLYYCGFFKREKRQELNQLRAEHHRKSMVAAAAMRTSMMIQSSALSAGEFVGGLSSGGPTSGAESRENLTEAEFHNDDMDENDTKPKNVKGEKAEVKNENKTTEVEDKEDVVSVQTTEVDL